MMKDRPDVFTEGAKVSQGLTLHGPAGVVCHEGAVVDEFLRVHAVQAREDGPFFANRHAFIEWAELVKGGRRAEHEGGHRLGSGERETSHLPPELPPAPGAP